MKKLLTLTYMGIVCLLSGQASAATLSLAPSSQTIQVGESIGVDLVIAGLGNAMAPSLGSFFVETTFDDSVVSFDSVTYGPLLGDPDDPLQTDIVTTVEQGSMGMTVQHDVFSFLSSDELDALQSDTFTLATLSFTGIGVGNSPLEYGEIDLSDALDSTIEPTGLAAASITVVPLPAALLLFLSGFGSLMLLPSIGRTGIRR